MSTRSRSSPAKNRSQRGVPPHEPAPTRDTASDDEVPTTSLRTERLTTLSNLAKTLSDLKQSVKLPKSLTFQPTATASAPKLAFEPNNAPFLAHEDALVKLLTQLDGVQSEGDQVVREQRKKIVNAVEAELARLDSLRKAEFERVQRGDPPLPDVEAITEGGEEVEDERTRALRQQREKVDNMMRAAGSGGKLPERPLPPTSHAVAEQILENEHGKRADYSRGRGSPQSGSEEWSEAPRFRQQQQYARESSPSQTYLPSSASDRYSKMSRREGNFKNDRNDYPRHSEHPQARQPPPPRNATYAPQEREDPYAYYVNRDDPPPSSRPPPRANRPPSVGTPFFHSLPSRFDQQR